MPATTPKPTYAMKGRLELSSSGWLLLQVPNDIGNGLFKSLSEHGVEQPVSGSTGKYNAHVSVMRPEEIEQIGGPDKIKARGQTVGFNLGGVQEIANPAGWDEVSKVWVAKVQSPELMKLRRSLGLGDPKYPFHMTFAIRKKNALKAASLIHFDKEAAVRTAIRPSPIEGRGLFATTNFQDGDTIHHKFMTRMPSKNGKDQWDQSEECRYTNHSPVPNCVIVMDGDHVKLVANRDITSGEELTGDYANCERILGTNYDFNYRGKPYRGDSDAQQAASGSVHGAEHPASRSMVSILRGSEDADAERARSDRDGGDSTGGRTDSLAGASSARTDQTAVGDHHSGSEAGSDHRSVHTPISHGVQGVDDSRDQSGGHTGDSPEWLQQRFADGGNDAERLGGHGHSTDPQRQPDPRSASSGQDQGDAIKRASGILQRIVGCPLRDDGGSEGWLHGTSFSARFLGTPGGTAGIHERGSDSTSRLLLKLASETVNRNRVDYGERLKNLRKRRGECPSCGQPFKEDEPYPDVENCEVCETFGPHFAMRTGLVPTTKEASIVDDIEAARINTVQPVSDAQAEAGNYAKGKFRMHGMQFSLENPKGSTRSGTDKNGKKWSSIMTADYGYINRTLGKDGDHVDVFVGPDPDTEMVFVVDQEDPDTHKFDEHKVMFGYKTKVDAENGYASNYSKGWKGLRNITPMTMSQFKWWLQYGNQGQPVSGITLKAA